MERASLIPKIKQILKDDPNHLFFSQRCGNAFVKIIKEYNLIKLIPKVKEKPSIILDDEGRILSGDNGCLIYPEMGVWDWDSVKVEHKFKPFDKVLVRDRKFDKWCPISFGYYDKENSMCPYVCESFGYAYCIPYEGNEDLIGIKKSPEE